MRKKTYHTPISLKTGVEVCDGILLSVEGLAIKVAMEQENEMFNF